ncbi:MAG: hypothetical protein AAGA48_19480 [Myxococcota bacterium]
MSWEQTTEADVRVEYLVDGEWQTTPDIAGKAGPNVKTVMGIPLGETSDWRIVSTDGSLAVDSARPIEQSIPRGMPLPTVIASDPKQHEPTAPYILVSINQEACSWCGGNYWLMIIDRAGRPVWATKTLPNRWILYAQVSVTGNALLWDEVASFGEESVAHRS